MLIRIFIIVFLTLLFHDTSAQRDANWVLGDSVGINFNTNPPSIETNRIIESMEATASISDSNGNLLFYAGAPLWGVQAQLDKFSIRGANDSIMIGGDSIFGHSSMTQGLLILPFPFNNEKYYIFHIGYKYPPVRRTLFYSIVDMSLNAGMGAVVMKNIVLSDSVSEKLTAVKAANGIDWWVVFAKFAGGQVCKMRLDSMGISSIYTDTIELGDYSTIGQSVFSKNGNYFAVAGGGEPSKVYNFNRCTGELTNEVTIDSFSFLQNNQGMWRYGAAFSANEQYFYLATHDSLWQFDMNSVNIATSKQLIFSIFHPQQGAPTSGAMAQLMLGPNDKIYVSNFSQQPDSLSQHLSVIDLPNNPGVSCDFLPYSFSLNGKQSLLALPNMVNYNLGIWEGGNCDSILAGDFEQNISATATCFPNPAEDLINFSLPENESLISGKIYSVTGELIFEFNQTPVNIITLNPGIYIYHLKSVNNKLFFGKIVKQ